MEKRWYKFRDSMSMSYFGLLFFFFCFISYNTPLTHDDWMWGSNAGTELLMNFYKDYNGRYVSNTLEIIVTRLEWVRILVLASFSTLLVVYTGKLIDSDNKTIISLVAFPLFMLVPIKIYAQTFGWVAGYVNYIPPIVFLLIYLSIVKNILDDEVPIYKKHLTYLFIPLGIVSQLFVEHVTLFSVFTGGLVIIYTYYKHKRQYSVHWAYFISSILGSVIMFTNSAYLNVLQGGDKYRSIKENIGLFERFYTSYKEGMYQILFIENNLIISFISVLLIIFLLRTKTTKWVNNILKTLSLFIFVSFNLFLLVLKDILGNQYLGSYTVDFEVIFTLLFFLTIISTVLVFVKENKTKIRLFYYLSGIVLLTIPFVFITPYGPRTAFGAYTFMVLFSLELLVYINQYKWSLKCSIKKGLFIVNTVIMIAFGLILFLNGEADRERMEKLERALNNNMETVRLTELPYPQFHWLSSPRRKMLKMFDNTNEIEIKAIPYSEYKNNRMK
ncbi:DUF6056 family protein [Virgibacillus sp. JSM 102003]|uniref:DUF6056 family protein n=1 Tax=Virgibacillus sp. JSM 102003 TaxID=1562108 RepID=UPI0035C268F3